ncbi:MAG: hypothetical protein ABIJ18_00440 [archaeon]
MSKGQVDESFKYIFGIIIGAMFLVFFIVFAWRYIAYAGSVSDADLATAIDNDLVAFSVSESAQHPISYSRDMDITIFEGKITPKGLGYSKYTGKVIYSPLELQGEEFYVATKTWFLPYKVTNFFYITDKNTFYVIVYDQGSEKFKEEMVDGYSAMPDNFVFEAYEQNNLIDNMKALEEVTSGYEQVRFIFLTEQNFEPELDDYSVISVTSTDEEFEYGKVNFEDGSSIYLSKEMLIGAFVAENKDAYDYNLELALEELQDITTIYYEKSKFLSSRMPQCEYASVRTALNNYKSYIGDVESYTGYSSYVETVDKANKNLGGGCPEIF